MAKDNLFLGTARGSVGDVTFSRLNGVQVARVRNRSPRNPQSPAQMVQRIIMSTVGKAYSFMSAICDHSFEGFESGQLSQRKFMEVNVGIMRDLVADVLAYPVEEVVRSSTAFNFSFKNDYAPVINRLMISAGSLPSIPLVTGEQYNSPTIAFSLSQESVANFTYADLVTAIGAQRGDQLTFVQVTHNGSLTGHDKDVITGFRYARVILEPNDGDMSTVFVTENAINKPNERNEGNFSRLVPVASENASGLNFRLAEVANPGDPIYKDREIAGSAVILSRNVGGRWLRSTQFIVPYFVASALNNSTLGLAYETYRIGAASDLYLNQAE